MADEPAPGWRHIADLADRFDVDSTAFAGIVALTAVGLLARLLALSARPMHYDEARVAYWGLRGAREGLWSYKPVVHGPLMQHFNRWLFPVLGSGDFVARLPVAVIGGLLPLSVLLFRRRLRDVELVALAGLLAVNPLLLYYSRFMRSDVLVAAFALVALGALVRLYESGRPAYLYGASGAFALAFASKENAIVYVLCWVGMLGLVAVLEVSDPRRFESRRALYETARDRGTAVVEDLRTRGPSTDVLHGVGALAVFVLIVAFAFAPRAPPGQGVGLWHSAPATVLQHVAVDVVCGIEFWSPVHHVPVPDWAIPGGQERQPCLGFSDEGGPLANYGRDLGRQLQILGKTASAVVLLSFVGVFAEFRRQVPRVIVPAAFYWGVASLLGYPVGADILFPAWVAVHTVVPLTIPAAAGAVAVGEWILEAWSGGDTASVITLGFAALLLVGSTAGAAVHHSYVAPTGTYWDAGEGQMVQFAQPEQTTKAAIDATRRASEDTDGVDVFVYDNSASSNLVDMGGANDHAVPCMKFLSSLPLSWYLYSAESDVDCGNDLETLEAGLAANPPVVIATAGSAQAVRSRLGPDYVDATYELRRGSREVVFFFDRTRVDPPARALSRQNGALVR